MATRTPVAVVGAGKIGQTIADLLLHSGDYRVTVLDHARDALERLPPHPALATVQLEFENSMALAGALAAQAAVISAAPFAVTAKVAEAARAAQVHYLDLTEDTASTRRVRELAEGSTRAFIPQCGLAPGFITVVGVDLARHFDTLQELRLRVGALPLHPSNALGYSLSWSTEGLINEYCEPCEELVNGVRQLTVPLDHCEPLLIDGVHYEAFSTSGGVGTLCESLAGHVQNLSYRTIRYPGHAALMKFLLDDLRLRERRALLKDLLEYAVPATSQDVVIVYVTAIGYRQGRLLQESYANRIVGREINGTFRSAIQVTTAASACAVLDLLVTGKLPRKGFVRQEEIMLSDMLANRFGHVYAPQVAS
jgi:saccharopine dehydrogenase-like NADP-dependent oxidoreductase